MGQKEGSNLKKNREKQPNRTDTEKEMGHKSAGEREEDGKKLDREMGQV